MPVCLTHAHDQALVRALRHGHPDAFTEIYRRYRPALTRFAAGFVAGRTHGPEDVVQDAFLRARAALLRDDRDIDLRPWLYRLTRNRCLDELRRTVATSFGDEPPDAACPTGDPHAALMRRDAFHQVVTGIHALPDRQRRALVEHALDGRSHADVAERLEPRRTPARPSSTAPAPP